MPVGLGELVALTFRADASGKVRTLRAPGRWLAWMGDRDRGDLVVVRPSRERSSAAGAVPPRERAAHRRFHGAAPAGVRWVAWRPRPASATRLGLVVSVTYHVPPSVRSPRKQVVPEPIDYTHSFGDHGGGKVDPSDRFKPELWTDARGGLWIVRRRGNAYRLDRWLRS